MTDFNDLDSFDYERNDQFDLDSSPLLGLRDEGEARLSSFSPIVSPMRELLAHDRVSNDRPLPDGSLSDPSKFSPSAPPADLDIGSPIPLGFRLENAKKDSVAKACPSRGRTRFTGSQLEEEQADSTQPPYFKATGEVPRKPPAQQSRDCQGQVSHAQQANKERTLNLPKDRVLDGRERLVTAALCCLPLLTEGEVRKVLEDCLPHLLFEDLMLVVKGVMGPLDSQTQAHVRRWGSSMIFKEEAHAKALRLNGQRHPPQGMDLHPDTHGHRSFSRTHDPTTACVRGRNGSKHSASAAPEERITEEPEVAVTSVQCCTQSHVAGEYWACEAGDAAVLHRVRESPQIPTAYVESGRGSLASCPIRPVSEGSPTLQQAIPSSRKEPVALGVAKTITKLKAPASRRKGPGKAGGVSATPRKKTQGNAEPENTTSFRYLETWKQTLAQKEARLNAAKSRAKRKRPSSEAESSELSRKRIALPDKNERPMSEAAKYIAQKHADVRRRNMEKKQGNAEAGLDCSQTQVSAPGTAPSRFCHLCTRTAKPQVLLVCGNVSRGTCRKVICFRCAEDQGWSFEELKASRTWTCTHCRQECPKKAQCHTYKRVNQHRRGDGRQSRK